MNNKRGRAKAVLIVLIIIALVAFITFFFATRSVAGYSKETLESLCKVKTLEIESTLSGQLALVRQMVKTPSIISYIQDPNDKEIESTALKDLQSYCDSFSSHKVFWISDVDKKFYSDMQYSYTLDPSDSASYWYNMTLLHTEVYNFNINYNPELNETSLWVNVVVRDEGGKAIGIAGTGFILTDFIARLFSGIDSDIAMYMFNDDYAITMAKDSSVVGNGTDVRTHFKKALGGLQQIDYNTPTLKVNNGYTLLFAPLEILGFHLVLARRTSLKKIASFAVAPLASCVVILLIAGIITVFMKFYSLINVIVKATQDLSSGHANLSVRLNLDIGRAFNILNKLVDALNKFIEKLQGIVKSVKDANKNLSGSGQDLKDCTQDTASSITQIIANIDNMGKNIVAQADSVNSTSSAVTQITSNITSLERMIEGQTESVQSATGSVDNIVGNIASVNEIASSLSSAYVTLQEKTRESVRQSESVNRKILEIQEQSKALQDANITINSIAEQTSLLAMNAAIEAAHAGETGKGFSVVADEIRKLSVSSGEQTKTIGDKLTAIETSITAIVEESKSSQEVLHSVSRDIQNTTALVEKIASSMQEQKASSDDLKALITQLGDNSVQVKNAAVEMNTGSRAILNEITVLNQSSTSMKGGMEEMSIGAKKINETGASLTELTHSMDKAIKNITEELEQFTV